MEAASRISFRPCNWCLLGLLCAFPALKEVEFNNCILRKVFHDCQRWYWNFCGFPEQIVDFLVDEVQPKQECFPHDFPLLSQVWGWHWVYEITQHSPRPAPYQNPVCAVPWQVWQAVPGDISLGCHLQPNAFGETLPGADWILLVNPRGTGGVFPEPGYTRLVRLDFVACASYLSV